MIQTTVRNVLEYIHTGSLYRIKADLVFVCFVCEDSNSISVKLFLDNFIIELPGFSSFSGCVLRQDCAGNNVGRQAGHFMGPMNGGKISHVEKHFGGKLGGGGEREESTISLMAHLSKVLFK